MARLSFEELGLLRILEKVQERGGPLGPAVRYALVERGLIEGSDPIVLTLNGKRVLNELRARPMRATGEFPALDLNRVAVGELD